ncbi:hypothetical protein K466DRAFT_592191 [Polyporus arcularius HHB13444]|uniref:MYND-type domain-containing protein n=1 Tax=Polyporus arcularius HHB13444 TaxID=1314778 RepID=A0A5C3NTT7_9APHY|nr:hypothetical protein K466DRAFT_592191 [Polyporus arcularius HHB13444]
MSVPWFMAAPASSDCTHCAWCGEESPDMKRCSGCRKIAYCSPKCQKDQWPAHIFDCKVNKPISTVYYLSRDIRNDVIPVDGQTRIDYGFDKASKTLRGDSENNLLSLYKGLFMLGVTEKELRKWQSEGTLVENIKKTYEALPPENRGGYYPWFLQHQDLLDGSPVDPNRATQVSIESNLAMWRKGWAYMGGSPNATELQMKAGLSALSPERTACFMFVSVALSSKRPNPFLPSWLTFGFVSTNCGGAEIGLGGLYQDLVKRCTFDEFCTAYETSTIPALFESKGLGKRDRLFCDVMSGSPHSCKSVWHLKHYIDKVVSSKPGSEHVPSPEAGYDYGYNNCKGIVDWKLLDDLYTKLFAENSGADPLQLHEAFQKGELLEFAKKYVKLAPWTAKYTRLLKTT